RPRGRRPALEPQPDRRPPRRGREPVPDAARGGPGKAGGHRGVADSRKRARRGDQRSAQAGGGVCGLAPYCAVQPPSMEKLAPLAEAPRSLTRYSIIPVSSSVVTNRLVGCEPRMTSFSTCSL